MLEEPTGWGSGDASIDAMKVLEKGN